MADYIRHSIEVNDYVVGEKLPSINYLSRTYNVSRDTVFKAFLALKEKGIINSIQGKSYYVANPSTNIFLLLDEYTPFKEALYNNFVQQLPSNYKVDLWFHQYNKNLFDALVEDAIGRYNKYVVMNYDNENFSDVLTKIDKDRLLLIDFGKFDKNGYSYVCQDFDKSFYDALTTVKEQLSAYDKLVYILNKNHKHPQSSKEYFKRFCADNGFAHEVKDEVPGEIAANNCYIVIKQTDVVDLIKQSKKQHLQMSRDFGLIAYNENPFYEVLENGIPCISIDFNQLGNLAADFVIEEKKIQSYLPTVIYRENLI